MQDIPSVAPTSRLLAALPDLQRLHFLSLCESVNLRFGEILVRPDEPIGHVYFPTGAFISLMMPLDSRRRLEVGMIGDEGMWGVSAVLGVEVSPLCAWVQGAGTALRMDASAFRRELSTCPELHALLTRYLHVILQQFAQMAACNRYHVVEARLARWLLMTQDRSHSNGFHLTHELLASMLGVRRVGVTKAASSLQRRALIRYHRGDIAILDRHGLEAAACGCYLADQQSYARLLA